MKMKSAKLLLLWGLLSLGFAGMQGYPIPPNLQKFYNEVRTGTCEGDNILPVQGLPDRVGDKRGFHDIENGPSGWSYCQTSVAGKAIFLQGPMALANMDIDCDGDLSYGGDGRCKDDPSGQPETSFKNTVATFGIPDLNAYVHPYVVFGNIRDSDKHPEYTPMFNPENHNVKPLSVMAVVCGTQLVYGIWGDTNGDTSKVPLVGEASLALATACFGKDNVSGGKGYGIKDVLYIAFRGDDTVPGPTSWMATNFNEFEMSIQSLGDQLVDRTFKP